MNNWFELRLTGFGLRLTGYEFESTGSSEIVWKDQLLQKYQWIQIDY